MTGDPRVLDPHAIRAGVLTRIDRRIQTQGEISFPAAPGLLDFYLERLTQMFASMGKALSPEELEHLKSVLEPRLQDGFADSPHARIHVKWESEPPPGTGLDYRLWLVTGTVADQYEQWASAEQGAQLFGANPDAKLLAVARTLGSPAQQRILDLGAGIGRNALPLARAGYPTDALELTGVFCKALRQAAETEHLPLTVIEGNVLDPALRIHERYSLVVCSEVTTHFRTSRDLRSLFERALTWLRDDGWFLLNAFVPIEGHEPDQLAREVSQVAWSTVFTRRELSEATRDLPVLLVSDEPVYAYEKEHQPAAGWPPTSWFEDWARGFNGYGVEGGLPPIELRWLLYRRR